MAHDVVNLFKLHLAWRNALWPLGDGFALEFERDSFYLGRFGNSYVKGASKHGCIS